MIEIIWQKNVFNLDYTKKDQELFWSNLLTEEN